jgi:hypothetical protein
MHRRTFLQGAAVSVAAGRFAPAFAQQPSAQQSTLPQEPTTIYSQYADELRQRQINPLEAPPEILRQFGLPRPPSQSSPAYPVWRDIFSRELRYSFSQPMFLTSTYQTNPRFQQVQPRITTRYESSPNWSGAYVHPRDGNMMVEIVGSWRIPGISMPGGLSGALPPACTIWVGLDGQRRYINSSLPQIGTRQEFDTSGTPKYTAWYQWWVRGQASPVTIPQVPISLQQGDKVLCMVQASGPSEAFVAMAKLGPSFAFWSTLIVPGPSPFTGQLPII